jgi:hypothetical protein
MNIVKQISNEPITDFKRVVHYAGLEDYPAIFQPGNIPTITTRFIVEYYLPNSEYLIKRIAFQFKIDNNTKVNPYTGALSDQEGSIGEKDFFDFLLLNPVILTQVVEGYIIELDNRGDWNEENWFRREVKPYPFV